MNLTPAQSQILSDTHRFRVLVCGRKFGKTSLAIEELIAAAIFNEYWRVMYIAPTLNVARQLVWDRLKQRLKGAIIKANDTRLELKVRTQSGASSDIFLGSWELYDNYRGDEFDFIIYDETQDYKNFWVGWQEAMRPTLTPRKGQAMFMGTPKGFNHFYDLYNMPFKDEDWQAFRFSSYDNPHIDREELEKARKDETEERFAQEYLAEFKKAEGLVFKEFRRETHIYYEPIRGYSEFLGGVDFGFTNPTAIPQVVVKEGKYYVQGELYKTGMTDEEVADYVFAQRFTKVYPDPENPAAIQMMKRKGVNIREVKKGKDSIQHGINTMRELFKQNRLFIHSSCINLIGELEMYAYPEKRINHSEGEKPIDEFNHAIDAVRYVVDNHSMQKPFVRPYFRDKTLEIWRGR